VRIDPVETMVEAAVVLQHSVTATRELIAAGARHEQPPNNRYLEQQVSGGRTRQRGGVFGG
jgi:hypothetical protein